MIVWYLRDRCWSLPCTWIRRVLWCPKIWRLAWWRWDPSLRTATELCRSMCYTPTVQPANMRVGAIVNHLCDDFISVNAKAVNHRVNNVATWILHILRKRAARHILYVTSITRDLITVKLNLSLIKILYKERKNAILYVIYILYPLIHVILYITILYLSITTLFFCI